MLKQNVNVENTFDGQSLRNALLHTIKDLADHDPNNLQAGVILGRVEREMNLRERGDVAEQ